MFDIMLVVDLHCEHDHVFEGWFASADDLSLQKSRGLLSCPLCGSHDVTRRPAASRLNVSSLKEAKQDGTRSSVPTVCGKTKPPVEEPVKEGADRAQAKAAQALQALYLQVVRHVIDQTEDVGERFADEARSMHHGDAEERPIRGIADERERAELKEEGIDVVSMHLPDFMKLKGPLQ
jgi:hypothetical protein